MTKAARRRPRGADRHPPGTAHCSPVARRHLSALSEQETTGDRGWGWGARPESQDPGTCRTPGRGALGGIYVYIYTYTLY